VKQEYFDYLNDILKSMNLTQEFVTDFTFQAFIDDEKTQYAVIRCLEIIGEATKRLPDKIRDDNPTIPWKAMAGMRDRLIHGYDIVDSEIIWITIQKTIPDLIRQIEGIL